MCFGVEKPVRVVLGEMDHEARMTRAGNKSEISSPIYLTLNGLSV
jgi:hypothetical protein